METNPEDSLEDRLNKLESKLAQARTDEDEKSSTADDAKTGMSQALKHSSEFIGAVIVGTMIGYLLDLALATKPWGMIVFLLLGFCAGVLNVLRSVGAVKSPHPVDRIGTKRK